MAEELFTVGYQRWRAGQRIESLIAALKKANIDLLVDIRHSPAASNPSPGSMYSPTEINLQAGHQGITRHLKVAGFEYLWLVELGNPQKNDREMSILKSHLQERDRPWPVQRGLQLLVPIINSGKRLCLLCSCKEYKKCHRSLIADALKAEIPELVIRDL
jgi:uncharacterized protein (DUF488 family)